jgi:hypothetical protein
VQEKLDIALRTEQWGRHPTNYGRPAGLEGAGHVAQDARPYLWVTDDTLALRDDGFARFELGLYQDDEVASGLRKAEERLGHDHQGNKGQIGDHDVELAASDVFGLHVAHVGVFHNLDPRVAAQPRQHLAVAHVHGNHPGGASLEEAIGEAPCGRAGVEGDLAGHAQTEVLESSIEFFPASASEARRRAEDQEGFRRADLPRWLSGHGAANEDLPGRHQGARLGPVGGQAPVYELGVEPSPGAQFSPAPRSMSGADRRRLCGGLQPWARWPFSFEKLSF